jgi:hypothetical protein
MELATVLVAIGGNKGNTVPRYDATPAEVMVLQRIHGDDSVMDIEPTGTVERSSAAEMGRLAAIYGSAKTEDNAPVLQDVFPGRVANVPARFGLLGLSPALYKPVSRAAPAPEPEPEEEPEPEPAARPTRARKAKAEAAPAPAPEPEIDDSTADIFGEDADIMT